MQKLYPRRRSLKKDMDRLGRRLLIGKPPCNWKFKYQLIMFITGTIYLCAVLHSIGAASLTIGFDKRFKAFDSSLSGKSIASAWSLLDGISSGITITDGKVCLRQITSWNVSTRQPQTVMMDWLSFDSSSDGINITSTGTYVLTAKNIATLTVHVVGAQGQGLNGAYVEIKISSGIDVFSGISNEQGFVSVEVPYGMYSIRVEYKGFENMVSATVNSPDGSIKTVAMDVFVEVLGIAMSFATFVLWIVIAVMVVLVLAIMVHEYHIYRRKKMPQLFGIPKVRSSHSFRDLQNRMS
jgi:hypothetical protein